MAGLPAHTHTPSPLCLSPIIFGRSHDIFQCHICIAWAHYILISISWSPFLVIFLVFSLFNLTSLLFHFFTLIEFVAVGVVVGFIEPPPPPLFYHLSLFFVSIPQNLVHLPSYFLSLLPCTIYYSLLLLLPTSIYERCPSGRCTISGFSIFFCMHA